MAIMAHLLPLKFSPQLHNFQTRFFSSSISLHAIKTKTRIIPCSKKISDRELASDLAAEISKINTQKQQREEAMKKSSEILFTELCKHLGFEDDELKIQWKDMVEEEKSDLVKGFVTDWGSNFHPLSAKSVKEMVDEYLLEDTSSAENTPSILFPGLRKMMGF